jgi:hypothetical protein
VLFFLFYFLASNFFYVRPRSGAPEVTALDDQTDRKAAEKARKVCVRGGALVQGDGESGPEADYFVHDHAVRQITRRYVWRGWGFF